MGSCFSFFPDNRSSIQCESQTSILYSTSAATAKVVTLKGDLVEYKVPVFVSQVLQVEAPSSFLCNSDCLLFDDYIPVMDLDDDLQANQIYFVLPTFKLQDKLSASDMAALAVKASVALQNASKKGSNRRKRQAKARISPVLSLNDQSVSILARSKPKTSFDHKHKLPVSGSGSGSGHTIGISRSASVKRLRTYTSRRAKLAARSFRLRLGTIYEGIVM